MDAAEVAELIAAYDAGWNAQDLDAICSRHHDDIVFHNHTAGEAVEGADAVRAHIAGIFERWPTMRFSSRRQYHRDDLCVSEWTASATHPDDGRRLEWDGVDVFPIKDGLIARKDVYSSSGTPRVIS